MLASCGVLALYPSGMKLSFSYSFKENTPPPSPAIQVVEDLPLFKAPLVAGKRIGTCKASAYAVSIGIAITIIIGMAVKHLIAVLISPGVNTNRGI